jgi:hypothetical protein
LLGAETGAQRREIVGSVAHGMGFDNLTYGRMSIVRGEPVPTAFCVLHGGGGLDSTLFRTQVLEGHCQLSRFGGVLLVSGSPERYVKVLYVLWSLVHSLLGLLCWGALAFGAWAHISSYPPSEGSAVRTFFDSLRTAPLKSEPGHEHPLWDQGEKGKNGRSPDPTEEMWRLKPQTAGQAEISERRLHCKVTDC